jgi:hypothetical protein
MKRLQLLSIETKLAIINSSLIFTYHEWVVAKLHFYEAFKQRATRSKKSELCNPVLWTMFQAKA